MHEGQKWRENTTIYPGETFDIKLIEQGLHKARFHFEDLIDITRDSLIKSESEQIFRLKVPLDINKKSISIYNYSTPTGRFLQIREYQQPREFDYIYINYGELGRRVDGIKAPILYDKVIKDLTLTFYET